MRSKVSTAPDLTVYLLYKDLQTLYSQYKYKGLQMIFILQELTLDTLDPCDQNIAILSSLNSHLIRVQGLTTHLMNVIPTLRLEFIISCIFCLLFGSSLHSFSFSLALVTSFPPILSARLSIPCDLSTPSYHTSHSIPYTTSPTPIDPIMAINIRAIFASAAPFLNLPFSKKPSAIASQAE